MKPFVVCATAWCMSMATHQATAQELPPIFDDVPVEQVPTQQVSQFPVNTFLENLVVDTDGTLYVTSHEAGEVIRVEPDGAKAVFAQVPGKIAGITLTGDSTLLVTGWDANGTPTVFEIDASGEVETLVSLPEAMFLNGITPLADSYLIADSYGGVIWQLDPEERTARVWLEHPLLARQDSESVIPAVNGLKVFEDNLYASNTEQMLVLQIPIDAQGEPGEPEVFVRQANIDDFAFDTEGNLYGATHIYNSVVQITPQGEMTTIAQAEQGLTGSTALAFGRTESDRTSLYVVTNGGMFLPPPSGVVPAEVVRLEVGTPGYSSSASN